MNKLKIIFTTVIALIAAIAFGETYTVETGQFEKLKINGNIRLIYKNLPDSTGYATYEAPVGNENIFSFSIKKDGTLRIEPSDEKWGQLDLPTVHVYSDFLTSVESYSELTVDILSIAPNSTFTVTQVGNGSITVDDLKSNTVKASINTGNGSIYLSGDCVTANFRMIGSGLISADRLSAENVKCRVLGTGSIGCWPLDNLTVSGLGSTKIYYKGKPNIKKMVGGKLFELPSEIQERKGAEVKSLTPKKTEVKETKIEDKSEIIVEAEDDDDNLPTIVVEDD